MIKTTFYVVKFTKADRYVGVAHNYDEAVLFSTYPARTYSAAKVELENLADDRGAYLAYFDGEYTCEGNGAQMFATDGKPVVR
jgi:hypothetical protein